MISARGLSEIIRIILVFSKQEYEEISVGTYNKTDQPEGFKKLIKDGELPFDQLPIWVEEDGFKLTQSKAISRHLARKFKLFGKDEKEEALVDMYSEALDDVLGLFSPILREKDKEVKQELKVKLLESGNVERWFGYFEKILKNRKTKHIASDEITFVDLKLWQAFDGLGIELLPKKHFPTLHQYVCDLLKIKVLSDYSESDKRFPVQSEW